MLLFSEKFALHATRLAGNFEHYLLRVFSQPLAEIEPETGQPWKSYIATCVVSVVRDRGEVVGALAVPKGALTLLRQFGRALNLSKLTWEQWDLENKVILPPTVLNL